MSLYLTIFDGDVEVTGWVMGHYSDFGCFRDCIRDRISGAMEKFPVFMGHSDCDGEWPVCDLKALARELDEIATIFQKLPPETPPNAFEHTVEFRSGAKSLYECFHNVDGENLFDALRDLARLALSKNLPILLQ
jgi:hypothetical protein